MEAKRKIKNKKTKKPAIKKSPILRYRAPQSTKTVDVGVPAELLKSSTPTLLTKPAIRIENYQRLSPFVISLLHEKDYPEETQKLKMNFAVSESEFLSQNKDCLSLTHEELLPQLLEEKSAFKLPRPKVSWSFSIQPLVDSFRVAFKNFENLKSPKKNIEPATEPLDLKTLTPVTLINTTSLPFDLPEIEDGEIEESEILTWEDILLSNNQSPQTLQTSKNWPQPWLKISAFFKKIFSYRPNISIPRNFGPLEMPFGWHRALAVFVLFSFIFVLPLHAMETIQNLRGAKSTLTQNSAEAVSQLNEAVSLITTNSASATTSFTAAKKNFGAAQTTFDSIGAFDSLLISLIPSVGATYKSGEKLITAGEKLAQAGEQIGQGLSAMQTAGLETTGRLAILLKTFESILPLLKSAQQSLEKVEVASLPTEYQKSFTELQTTLPTLIKSVEEIIKFQSTFNSLLGTDSKKRYLLLFQNNTELRPTGGFLGSFAVLDVSRGAITNLKIPEGGSYDLQGSLKTKYISPIPLQLLTARWEFQDANWFPDFPTSARQELQFFEEAGGPTVDGVVAINASFVSGLLNLLGPIEMPEYNRTIDSENFLFETQKIVELEFPNYQTNNNRQQAAPKAFIGDLATKLMARVQNADALTLLKLLEVVRCGLTEKDIQIYAVDETSQKDLRNLKWSGEIEQTDQDYLMIVNTNLGGGKTDGVIEEHADLKIAVQDDGQILNTLTISRTHHGVQGSLFTGVNNVDFLRVYVPKNSRLISASGFTIPDTSLFETPEENWVSDPDILLMEEETVIDPTTRTLISEENGKTVFGNWVQVKPGDTATVTFIYELPFKIDSQPNGILQIVKNKIGLKKLEPYSLFLQKQSGVLERTTDITVSWSEKLKLSEPSLSQNANFDNQTDHLFNVIFEQK